MRKITRDAAAAFMAKTPFKRTNTEVTVTYSGLFGDKNGKLASLLLHGNTIAMLGSANLVCIRTAGWNTALTRERLNALPNTNIKQRKGTLYLNEKEWSGEWVHSRYYITSSFNFMCFHCGIDLRTKGITERSKEAEAWDTYSLDNDGRRELVKSDSEGIDWEWECKACGGRLTEKQQEDFGH